MKDLIIIGAGGFGRELFHLSKECIGYGKSFKVFGYLDDSIDPLKNYVGYPPVIGKISSHQITENQVFICSISDVRKRSDIINKFIINGAIFINLIHITARIVNTSKLGDGCIIGPLVSIGADVKIGNFCLLQTGVIVGHDVEIGNNSRLDNYSILVADVKLKNNTTIHSNSVVNAKIIVEEGAVVGACSFVIRNVKPGSTVYGNPAKILNL
jgi:sugar O-acyltransferase (sialic acid O-acetyltransferase NeuD family)